MARLEDVRDRYGAYIRADQRQELQASTLDKSLMPIVRLRMEREGHGLTDAYDPQSMYMVGVQLRHLPPHRLWREGQPVETGHFRPGHLNIYDLRRDWVAELNDPFDVVQFYVFQQTVDEIAHEVHGKSSIALAPFHVANRVDPVLHHLALSLVPALSDPTRASRLFIDQVSTAIQTHLVLTYGNETIRPARRQGGLAPWQLRTAKELIESRLDGDVSIEELAKACRLSRSHFSRAFRASTGQSPQQWLTSLRVQRAEELLRSTDLPLTEVSLRCGFASASHLVQVFSRLRGMPPGVWRRRNGRSTSMDDVH